MDRRKIIKVALLIVVPVLLLILVLNGPSIVTISSEEGANIAVATSKDGTFKKIGTTKVTHLFFQKPSSIYVSAELKDRQTVASVKLARLRNKSVDLKLTNIVPVKKISDGAVVDAIFSGNKGQGIVYGQDILVNFLTDSPNAPVNPQFVGLPYVKKIVWYDFDNFAYQTKQGMGQFIGGSDKGLGGVGSNTSGDVVIDPDSSTEQGGPLIIDISRTGNNPLVLLSSTNIFTSTNMGSRLQAITSFDKAKSETHVFTTADSIFRVVNPPEGSDANAKQPQTTVEEFTYAGKKTRITSLDDNSEVVNITKRGSTTYILTKSNLYTINASGTQKVDLYFGTPADMVLYKNQVVVLANDGLWKLSDDSLSFQLLFKFTNNGVGLISSMSMDPNNQLLFGTTPASSDKKSNGATFVTSL